MLGARCGVTILCEFCGVESSVALYLCGMFGLVHWVSPLKERWTIKKTHTSSIFFCISIVLSLFLVLLLFIWDFPYPQRIIENPRLDFFVNGNSRKLLPRSMDYPIRAPIRTRIYTPTVAYRFKSYTPFVHTDRLRGFALFKRPCMYI